MISPLSEDARERYGYIYAKEKIFFDFTKFSKGIFSKDWTERGIFCGGCLAGMCGVTLRVLPLFLSFLSYKRKSAYLWAKVGTFGRKSINALPELMMT